jgi:hypothetical protein
LALADAELSAGRVDEERQVGGQVDVEGTVLVEYLSEDVEVLRKVQIPTQSVTVRAGRLGDDARMPGWETWR